MPPLKNMVMVNSIMMKFLPGSTRRDRGYAATMVKNTFSVVATTV